MSIAAAFAAVGHSGAFNYQVLDQRYHDISNYYVGAYWAGTGLPAWAMDAAMYLVLFQGTDGKDRTALFPNDSALAHKGLQDVDEHCASVLE